MLSSSTSLVYSWFTFVYVVFLAVQNSSTGDLVIHWLNDSLTHWGYFYCWLDIQRATQETCDLWDIWSEWWGDMCWQFWQFLHCWTILTMTMIILWDIDYNSDNWKPDFMTIFVTWQLRVTLDSICNSCDVYLEVLTRIGCKFKPVLPDPWHFIQCVMPYGSNQGKNRLYGTSR